MRGQRFRGVLWGRRVREKMLEVGLDGRIDPQKIHYFLVN